MKLLDYNYAELQNLDLKDFFKRLYTKAFDEEDIVSNSAQVGFYFAFALFPLLVFLVGLFGLVLISADDLRAEMFFYLRQVMPYSAYELVRHTIQEVTENTSGSKLTFGIAAALWAASAGIDSIRVVLNGVYNLTETRPWWKTKLLSLSMTLGLGVLVTVALGIVFYGSKFIILLLDTLHLPIRSPILISLLQGIIVLLVLVTIFGIIYNFLPNHKEPKWVWVSPGATVSIVLWLLLSYGFRLYLGYFNSYDKTYGSLGAMIILMLWLYLTALVILIGGSINAVLQEFTDPKTAEAGANKAAAKEIISDPEQNKTPQSETAADKKAEVLKTADQNDLNDTSEEKTDSSSTENYSGEETNTPKSKLKLFAGLLIGFVSNLRKK